MGKLVGRIVGFFIFLAVFCSATLVILAVSSGLIDPWQMFPGLPRPPQIAIDTGDIPIPAPQLPEIDIPDALKGEVVLLGDQVQRRPLMTRIPAPQQLSTEPRVIGANFSLAILMALIFGACTTVLGNMLRDEEPRIQAWLKAFGVDRLLPGIGKFFQWTASRGVKRGCLTLPFVALIFALYGIIFAFLEKGTSILSREGAFLAVTMAFSVGLVSFSGDIARRIMGRLWRTGSEFHVYPANLLIAALSVGISRLFGLSPGIAFGTPGGADMKLPEAHRKKREVVLAAVTLGTVLLFGALGWGLSGLVISALSVPFDTRIAPLVARLLTAGQNIGLALFLVALETGFFELLPLAYGDGRVIFRWNKLVWALVFIPLAFLFNHALLNPQSGFLDSFLISNVRFLWGVMLILVGLTAGLWFYFNVVDDVLRDWLGIRLPG
ncbi:MAG: hypothetical protein Kow00124_31990 [Anaerolineae bacterium]